MGKRRGRKGKADAWKNLVRVHRRGPKRVHTNRPRCKNGVMPLANPEYSKRIQVVDKTGFLERRTGISVFNNVFYNLGLKDGDVYTVGPDEPMRALRLLKKPLEAFGHNDHILCGRMREFKLDNVVGKCVALTGSIKNADATIILCRARQASPAPPEAQVTKEDTTITTCSARKASPLPPKPQAIEKERTKDNESSDGWSSDEED